MTNERTGGSRRVALLAGLAFVAAAVAVVWIGAGATPEPAAVANQAPAEARPQRRGVIDEPAPDLSLLDLEGNPVPLRDFDDKVVVFDFWAVWCGPCRVSLPFFQELEDRYREDGLVVVGLHVDDGLPELDEVRAYLADLEIGYLNLISTLEADEQFRVAVVPTTYITDRDGIVRMRHLGFNPERTPERLEEEIRGLLGLD